MLSAGKTKPRRYFSAGELRVFQKPERLLEPCFYNELLEAHIVVLSERFFYIRIAVIEVLCNVVHSNFSMRVINYEFVNCKGAGSRLAVLFIEQSSGNKVAKLGGDGVVF